MTDDGTQLTEAIRRLIEGGMASDEATWRSFDREAQRVFRRTLRRFWPKMQPDDVEDIISTSLHKILRNGGLAKIPLDTDKAARGYLSLTVQSVAYDRFRSSQRATTALNHLQSIVEAGATPSPDGADGNARHILDLLDLAVQKGLGHEVQLVRLRYLWSMRYEEMRIALGVDDTDDTIRKQVDQAVKRIREALAGS